LALIGRAALAKQRAANGTDDRKYLGAFSNNELEKQQNSLLTWREPSLRQHDKESGWEAQFYPG